MQKDECSFLILIRQHSEGMSQELQTKGDEAKEVVPVDGRNLPEYHQNDHINCGENSKVDPKFHRNHISNGFPGVQLRHNLVNAHHRKCAENTSGAWPEVNGFENRSDG